MNLPDFPKLFRLQGRKGQGVQLFMEIVEES